MSSTLRQLLELMTQSVETLERICDETGTSVPDLDKPYTPASDAFRRNPIAGEAANIITATAYHMAAIVSPPKSEIYKFIGGPTRAAAIRACLEANVSEILREAGPSGMHVDDIAKKNGHDAKKLARFLRYLATHHIYREVSPDVFAYNYLASMLDTFKPSAEVIADPGHKYHNSRGPAAAASHHLDITFKVASRAWEVLVDPKTKFSNEPADAPFSKAFQEDKTLWNLLERDSYSRNRFDLTMQTSADSQPADAIFRAYDWPSLPANSVVVEVGGGMGTSAFPLASRFPDLVLVVQDLPSVIAKAEKIWETKMPEAIQSGRVILQGHDCFAVQPQTNASIYLLKMILHDWSDDYSVKILSSLRQAARPDTTLVIIDCILPYACPDAGETSIPGAAGPQAPAPLLPNYGTVNEFVYNMDTMMHLLFNAQERTIAQFQDVLRRAGWTMKAVHRNDEGNGIFLQSIEAVPV